MYFGALNMHKSYSNQWNIDGNLSGAICMNNEFIMHRFDGLPANNVRKKMSE